MDLPGLTPDQRVTGRIAAPAVPKRPAAFDLKGYGAADRAAPAQLGHPDGRPPAAGEDLAAAAHVLHAPVLIDLGALEEASPLTVIQVVAILKACRLVPVAATNVPEAMRATIANEGLGILQAPPAPGRTRNIDADIDAMPDPDLPTPPPERVRGRAPRRRRRAAPAGRARARPGSDPGPGNQGGSLRRAGRDPTGRARRPGDLRPEQRLVVLAPVNAGAQVVADGHVHIYSKLRGRAVAGAKGLPGARIFVQRLEAELVAVADAYMSAEEIPLAVRGKAAQIWSRGRSVQSGTAVTRRSPPQKLALPRTSPADEKGDSKNFAVRRNDR